MVKKEFTTLSGSVNFIEERDFRLKLIKEKGLWNYIASKVLNAKGQPISTRSIRNTFIISKYEDLKALHLSIWMESEVIIEKIISESKTYGTTNKD